MKVETTDINVVVANPVGFTELTSQKGSLFDWSSAIADIIQDISLVLNTHHTMRVFGPSIIVGNGTDGELVTDFCFVPAIWT